MPPPNPHSASLVVIFSHGKESGPQGRKIEALSRVARGAGAQTCSVNYREHPGGVHHDHDASGEPERRVAQLLALSWSPESEVLLVGSSMGGYVSAVAASMRPVAGLFLLAPALGLPGYAVQDPAPRAAHLAIVHGWGDEVIPWQHSARFAEVRRGTLHLIDGDHRLDGVIEQLERLFAGFLRGIGR
jgi:pimeloyl-ACP methyl ester carboxylesterase